MTDGLKDRHRAAIIATIAANDRVERAVLFGSRATGTHSVSSDVDIALIGDRLTLTDHARLAAALDEIPMAQSVDLLLYDSILDRTLREHIRRQGVEWYVRSSDTRAASQARHRSTDEEWKSVALGNLVEVFDGPHATPTKTPTGSLFLRISNLASGRLDLTATEHLSDDDYLRWTRRVTPTTNDVVFSYETRIGEAALIPKGLRACLGRRMGLLRARDGMVDPRFLLYAFLGTQFQETLRARTVHGSTVDRIPLIEMPGFPIRVPRNIAEQRAIAHILGTLDDKIELNRRMNATLEAIARALFRSWFVDFDPVRAKMDGRDTGLPKEIADLFPDRLVDSELGEIPDGWVPSRLDSVAAITKGRSYRRRELVASDTALVTLKSFARGGGYRPDGLKPFRGVYKSEQVVRPGEVVVACTDVTQAAEVVGRSAIVGETPSFRTLVASLDILIVRPKSPAPGRVFIYYVTGTDDFVAHALARTTGTTVLHLSKDAVASFRFALPPTPLMERFAHGADVLRARIQTNSSAVGLLAGLRDNLLPKLVSGEVRVTGLEPPNGRDDHPTGRDAWSLTERRP